MSEPVLRLEIVTPDGVALEASVRELTAPSVSGEVGILPGHVPLMAALRTGIVRYVDASGESKEVAVGRGFFEVAGERATVLTDRFVAKGAVDAVRVRLELQDADEELERFEGDLSSPDYLEIVAREVWAATQLELYGDPPPPMVRPTSELREPVDYAELALTDEDRSEHHDPEQVEPAS